MRNDRLYLLRRRARMTLRIRGEVPGWPWSMCWHVAGTIQRVSIQVAQELRDERSAAA